MSDDGDNIVETLQGGGGDDGAPQQQFKFDPKMMENFKMPSIDELLKVLDTMDMDPEDKDKLREDLMARSAGGGFASGFGGTPKPQRMVPTSNDMVVFLVLVLLVAAIFGKILFST